MRINAGSAQSLRLSEHSAVTLVLPALYWLHRVTCNLGVCLSQPRLHVLNARWQGEDEGWGKADMRSTRQGSGMYNTHRKRKKGKYWVVYWYLAWIDTFLLVIKCELYWYYAFTSQVLINKFVARCKLQGAWLKETTTIKKNPPILWTINYEICIGV